MNELDLYYINLLMVAKYTGRDLSEIREVLKSRSQGELGRWQCADLMGRVTLRLGIN